MALVADWYKVGVFWHLWKTIDKSQVSYRFTFLSLSSLFCVLFLQFFCFSVWFYILMQKSAKLVTCVWDSPLCVRSWPSLRMLVSKSSRLLQQPTRSVHVLMMIRALTPIPRLLTHRILRLQIPTIGLRLRLRPLQMGRVEGVSTRVRSNICLMRFRSSTPWLRSLFLELWALLTILLTGVIISLQGYAFVISVCFDDTIIIKFWPFLCVLLTMMKQLYFECGLLSYSCLLLQLQFLYMCMTVEVFIC